RRPGFRQRSILGDLPFSCLLGWRRRARQGHAKTPTRKGFGQAGGGEIWLRGWLHAGRHLGTVRRAQQPSGGIHLSSRWAQETECRYNNLVGLQESWPPPRLDDPPGDGGRQAGPNLLY